MKTPFWWTIYWVKNWRRHNRCINSLIASEFLLCSWNFVVSYNNVFLLCLLHFLPSLTLLLSLRWSFLIIPLISCPTPISWYVVFVSPSLSFTWSPLSVSLFFFFYFSIPLCGCIFSLPTYFLSTCLYLLMPLFSYFYISDSPGFSVQVYFFLLLSLTMRTNNRTCCHFIKFTYDRMYLRIQ